MKQRRNPLSYLGWLGLIGFWGLVSSMVNLCVFFLFFFFFTYRAKVPDELFWINVYKAAARALAGYMAFFLLSTLAIYIRGCYFHLEPPVLQDGFYQVPIAQWQQSLWFAGLAFVVSLAGNLITPRVLNAVNKICGAVIIIYGLKLLCHFVEMV